VLELPSSHSILATARPSCSFIFSDFSETNYLRICWADFHNLFTEWKPFGCRWSIWTSFSDSSRDVAIATNFVRKWQTTRFRRSCIEKRNYIIIYRVYARLNSATNATISCKILVTISPVVSAENSIIDGNCVACSRGSAYFVEYLRIYWTDFCNLFTIWKRFTCRWWSCTLFSNLSSDIAIATKWSCRNEGKLILCAFFAHSPYGSKVLFGYCLLVGDTDAEQAIS